MKTLYIVIFIVVFITAIKSINAIDGQKTVNENRDLIFSKINDKDKHAL